MRFEVQNKHDGQCWVTKIDLGNLQPVKMELDWDKYKNQLSELAKRRMVRAQFDMLSGGRRLLSKKQFAKMCCIRLRGVSQRAVAEFWKSWKGGRNMNIEQFTARFEAYCKFAEKHRPARKTYSLESGGIDVDYSQRSSLATALEKQSKELKFYFLTDNQELLTEAMFIKRARARNPGMPRRAIRALFKEMDRDGDGELNVDEFAAFYDRYMQVIEHKKPTRKKYKAVKGRKVKVDMSKRKGLGRKHSVHEQQQMITNKFYMLSKGKDVLTKRDFKKMACIKNRRLKPKQAEKLFSQMDEDGSGSMELHEFVDCYDLYREVVEDGRARGRAGKL